MNLIEIFSIIIIHWFADFVMQDEKWALGKSKNWNDLLKHAIMYTSIWWIGIMILFIFYSNSLPITGTQVFGFLGITFIAHTITDYFTSRIVSKKFANNHYGSSIPNFGAFTIIGIDQILHYMQLFITYYSLK